MARLPHVLLAAFSILELALPSVARFYYPNFLDVTSLKLRGSAKKDGQCLLLSDYHPDQVGAFWYKKSINVEKGFFTAFNIRIKPPPAVLGGNAHSNSGGEGMAFVLHRSAAGFNALGLSGNGLGYSGLRDAIAIEFDSRQSDENEDPNGNHVSLHLPRQIPGKTDPVSDAFEYDLGLTRISVPLLSSGQMYTIQVSYDGETFKLFLSDLVNPILSYQISLSGLYTVGFTASTGSEKEYCSQHRVCDWYFETKSEDQCDFGFVGAACSVDAGPAVAECLSEVSCSQCLNHVRDCRWCSSQNRCVAGAVSSDDLEDLKRSFCEDPSSLILDEHECSIARQDFVSMWNNFMSLLLVLTLFSTFGRLATSPKFNQNISASNSRIKCFRNTTKIYHLFSLLESTCAGAIFAVLISYCVNYSFFLLTTYTAYSIGLGFLFVFIGGLILWQTTTQYIEGENEYFSESYTSSFSHCVLLACFSVLLGTSGLICMTLEKDSVTRLSPGIRILLFTAVGISLCFSIVFVVVDLATRLTNLCRVHQLKPIAEHPIYVRFLAGSAFISGIYFGYVFGMLDLENLNKSHAELVIKLQNYYCYPLGCFLGGITAFSNKFMSLPVSESSSSKKVKFTSLTMMQDGL